jgi:hypothetical protein
MRLTVTGAAPVGGLMPGWAGGGVAAGGLAAGGVVGPGELHPPPDGGVEGMVVAPLGGADGGEPGGE